jgi:hypothetical protein
MQDHDDRREQGWQDYPRLGRGGQSDNARATYSGEGRSSEPPEGGRRLAEDKAAPGAGRLPRSGGSYGQGDFSASAQRSPHREGYRYADSGEAGQGSGRERGAGGQGGHSGYGSSGQGQYGPGGFARGGYGASGYGSDYGQDLHGGGESRSDHAKDDEASDGEQG